MGRMKKGTPTGQCDINYKTIKVGDSVRSIHSGMVKVVNSYGSLEFGDLPAENKWKGSDYAIVKSWDEEFAENAKRNEEVKTESAAPVEVETATSVDCTAEVDAVRTQLDEWKALAQEAIDNYETEKAKREQGLASVTDQELALELRKRGYEVTATKTATVEL